jgi:hypothetical protein
VPSRHGAIIVAQQPTEAISSSGLTAVAPKVGIECDELLVEASMIPLSMIMYQILLENIGQRPLVRHEHLIQAFCLEGAHKPFTVGMEIRIPWGQDDGFHTVRLQQSVEGLRELRIALKDRCSCIVQQWSARSRS